MTTDADVIVVGAGPAGLSAALVLGRACRRVLVFDHGKPRNAAAKSMNGFLTRDRIPPAELLRLAREDLKQYDKVVIETAEVLQVVNGQSDGFSVALGDGRSFTARKLLVATGVIDTLPNVPGLVELYGQSVFHCPYCDGWEVRDQPLAVYGCNRRGYGLSLELLGWSDDVVLCSDGACELDAAQLATLTRNRIEVKEARIARLEGPDGILERIVFENGDVLPRRALFFTTGQTQASRLAQSLGCKFNEKGTVRTGKYESTDIPGLYVAGDASRDVQWVVVAAAEGAEAAYAINQELIKGIVAVNARGYRLLALALLLALTVPRMWQRGMFVDGMVYAVLARNLAMGFGSIWAPAYSATVYREFFEQPPLGFAIEALPFFIFGDHFWVERAFSVGVLIATGLVIAAIWRRLFARDYDWLPILFWLVPSVVTWAAINNMLENIQALVTTVAVYGLVRTCREPRFPIVVAWTLTAGLCVVVATLVKGPVGLFPLAVPFALLLLAREDRPRSVVAVAVALWATVAVCGLLLLSFDESERALVEFAQTHLLPALQGTRGDAVTLGDIVRHLAAGIAGRVAVVVVVLWLVRRRGAGARFTFEPATRFLLATALLASLPLLLSPKMAGHYFLPSIPYFALAGAAFALPAVRSFFEGRPVGVWAQRAPVVLAGALVLAAALVLAFHGTLERRDREMVVSLDAIANEIPRNQTIGTCRASHDDWGTIAYVLRFFRVSLDPTDAPANGWFLVANGVCAAPAECRAASEGPKLALYRCGGGGR